MYRLSSDLEEFQTTMPNRLEYKSKALIRVQLIYDSYKMTQTVHKKEQEKIYRFSQREKKKT